MPQSETAQPPAPSSHQGLAADYENDAPDDTPPTSRALNAGGPFGWLGGMGGLLVASTVFASSCGPTAEQADRAQIALVLLLPLAMWLAGMLVGTRTRARVARVFAAEAAALVLATGLAGAIALKGVDGLLSGVMLWSPFSAALCALSMLVAAYGRRATRHHDGSSAMLFAAPRAWRAAMLALIAFALGMGAVGAVEHRPLVPLLARFAAGFVVVTYAGLVAVVVRLRREALDELSEREPPRAPASDGVAHYRGAGPDAGHSDNALRALRRRQTLRDAATLLVAALAAAAAVTALLRAPAPSPAAPIAPIGPILAPRC